MRDRNNKICIGNIEYETDLDHVVFKDNGGGFHARKAVFARLEQLGNLFLRFGRIFHTFLFVQLRAIDRQFRGDFEFLVVVEFVRCVSER